MLNYKHPRLAQGQWQKFSFIEQMANVGSEVERCFKWKKKEQMTLANRAFERAVELLGLTILGCRTDGVKLKELLRVKECLIDSFAFDNRYGSSVQSWHSYFRPFNYAARLRVE